jgi:hypothetical protein
MLGMTQVLLSVVVLDPVHTDAPPESNGMEQFRLRMRGQSERTQDSQLPQLSQPLKK